MKAYVRRCVEIIESLGFENTANDYDRAQHRRFYVHPFHPDEQPIRIWDRASEQAWTAAARTAALIIGDIKAAPTPTGDRRELTKRGAAKKRNEETRRAAADLNKAAANLNRARKEADTTPIGALLARALTPAQRQRLTTADNSRRFYDALMKATPHGR